MKSYLVLLLMLTLLLNGCGKCSYVDEVEQVKALPQEKWEHLFQQIRSLAKDPKNLNQKLWKTNTKSPQISDFNYIFIEIDELGAKILLGGCLDNKAYLSFSGITEKDYSDNKIIPIIKLSWGEYLEHEKTLWSGHET